MRYVYFAARKQAWRARARQDVKIGISINVAERMKAVGGELIFAVPCEYQFARTLEYELHKQFDAERISRNAEWFVRSDRLHRLIRAVVQLGYWPWDRTPIERGTAL